MRKLITGAAMVALTLIGSTQLQAADILKTEPKPYNVTIRVFDPAKGVASGQDYVLPVDSPDAEHAAASTLANAASFTKKTDGGKVIPVAFICTEVEMR